MVRGVILSITKQYSCRRAFSDLCVKAAPLEVASSADGKRLFILTPGEILVYSVPEVAVTGRIPIAQETGLDIQRFNAGLKPGHLGFDRKGHAGRPPG